MALRLSAITLAVDPSGVEVGATGMVAAAWAAGCHTWIIATPSAVEAVREMAGGIVIGNETAKGTEIVIGNA